MSLQTIYETFRITEITITGIHGRYDVKIPVRDNKVILVGPNGTGKSTILQICTYFLGRKWFRLLGFEFDAISITINDTPLSVAWSEIALAYANEVEWRKSVETTAEAHIFEVLRILAREEALSGPHGRERRGILSGGGFDEEVTRFVQTSLGITSTAAEFVLRGVSRSLTPDVIAQPPESLQGIDATLKQYTEGQTVLYLPTYRRIEKELRYIFPENGYQGTSAPKKQEDSLLFEYVYTGMGDVQSQIDSRLGDLRFDIYVKMRELAGSYLSDVLSQIADKFNSEIILRTTDAEINRAIKRVNEIWSDEQTQVLRSTIFNLMERLRRDEIIEGNDKYILGYLERLIIADLELVGSEKPYIDFAELCNSYLIGKRFYFIRENSHLVLHDARRQVYLRDLSSGEKQIVSLFSHLQFSDSGNIIFIDEPELSLSVDWQQRFLVDVASFRNSSFLFAVTHSPFIFDNLTDYTVDIIESRTVRQ